MTYQVTFTESTNPSKPPIVVEDQTLNTERDITFVGKNYAGYGPVIAENFLHILENFAGPTEPSNPVQGQLWFDSKPNVNLLKVWDGTTWSPAGSIKKAGTAPLVGNSLPGDLWVDTSNQQLYLFSGSNWLLVGPQYSSGAKTGPQIEKIVDTNNLEHSVITMFVEDNRISITSKAAFTPKQFIPGFATINQGVNLSTIDLTSTTAPTKFWGVASQANALSVAGVEVDASNFMRKDQASTTNYPINIRADGGLSVGSDLGFSISSESNSTVLYSKNSGNSIDVKVNNAGTPTILLHVDANLKVGIGPNNTSPLETLDVDGNIRSSGNIIVNSTVDSTAPGVGSIKTDGGLSVAKQTRMSGDLSTYAKIYVNNLNISNDPQTGPVMLPGSDSASGLYDIGSPTRKFRNIYATSFAGDFSGSFTATSTINGNINGSAAKLASPTVFSLTGDVSSNAIAFNGQTQTGTAVFTTSITQDFIALKSEVTDSLLTDQLLIYRANTGLRKTSKQTFISNIATVPIGAIFPYAGSTVPTGYLLCDGSEVQISKYSALYSVIGYTYKTPSLLIGKSTFALPDLRGRFPLGRDNMENIDPITGQPLQVPSKDNDDDPLTPDITVKAGGGSANRVTDVTADTMGTGSGNEQRTLLTSNLPDHKHNLNSGTAQYYAAGLPGIPADPNGVPNLGMPNTSTGSGLPNSGGVISTQTGLPFNTMNPYLTINYIIFTGVLQ